MKAGDSHQKNLKNCDCFYIGSHINDKLFIIIHWKLFV